MKFNSIKKDINFQKSQKIQEIKSLANSELNQTDWIIVKQTETNYLSEEEYNIIKLKRQAIRDKSNNLELQINNASTYDEIQNINW